MRKTGTGRLRTAAAAAVFWTGAVLSGLLLLPALVCCGLSRLIWSAAERLQNALTLHGNPDCQKICPAESFGGTFLTSCARPCRGMRRAVERTGNLHKNQKSVNIFPRVVLY